MQQHWLFVASSGQQFTAGEEDVPALIRSGQIAAHTLMWREGMPQWMPAASLFPSLFAALAATQPLVAAPAVATAAAGGPPSGAPSSRMNEAMVRRLVEPLYERRRWIRLVGVMSIIGGVATLPALLLGLLLIFAGLAALKLAGQVERAQATGEVARLEEVNRQVAKFFHFQGVLLVVQLAVAAVLAALVLFGVGAALLEGWKESGPGADGAPAGGGTRSVEDIRFPDLPPPVPEQ